MPLDLARRARLGLAACALALGASAASAEDVTVFAAASLKNALDAIAAAWKEQTGNIATLSYAGSSALARQIEAGAPADLFVSADLDWMDYLAERGLIDSESRRTLLGNTLVLVAADPQAEPVPIAPGLDLATLLGDGRLAVPDTESVPAGRYARAALASLGAWDAVADRLAPAENVRAALAYVALGEAPHGIVYATDARAEPAVTVVGTFPSDSHPPILYPAALTAEADRPEAADFLAFLGSERAAALFEAEGFTLFPDQGPSADAR
jgi:molybdate transport system substrate-binding protein